MTLKPFQTQDGVRISTDPASIQITGNNIRAESTVKIQSGNPLWWAATQTYNKDGAEVAPHAVAYASNGDVFSISFVEQDTDDTAVTRLSSTGTVLWQKYLVDQTVLSFAVSPDDNVFLATADGTEVIFVLINGSTGAILWQTGIDTGWSAFSFVVAVDSEGSPIAVGSSEAVGEGGFDSLLVTKLNGSTGSVSWSKAITDNTNNLQTGAVACMGTDILLSARSDNGDNLDLAVFKLSAAGDILLQKKILVQQGYSAYAGQIAADVHGNIYLATSYSLNVANFDGVNSQTAATVTKLNNVGAVQWTRRIGPGPCGSVSLSLCVDELGDVYLAATTFAFGPGSTNNDIDQFFEGSTKIVLARYTPTGTVVWQRYLDAPRLWESPNYTSSDVTGNLLAVKGDRLLVAGSSVPSSVLGGALEALTGFVVQLPTSGDHIDIGPYKFTESRVPGRFVYWFSNDSTFVIEDQPYTTSTPSISLNDSDIANQLFPNPGYQFEFDGNGTLKLPNDGDLQLTQDQTGWISIFGPLLNNNDNIWFRATTGDSQGNMWAVGEEADNNKAFLVKYSPQGNTLYAVRLEHNSGDTSRANAIWYDETYGLLLIAVERLPGDNKSGLLIVDPDTGVIQQAVTLMSDDDVIITDVVIKNETVIAAGSKYGEWRYFDATPQTGSTTDHLVILRSILNGALPNPYGNWIITGTGITGYANITSVERYPSLTQTSLSSPPLGTGGTFDVTVTDGVYTSVVPNNGGSNYVLGRHIRILGTSLGGATPANDLVIEVSNVDSGSILNLSVVSGSGVGTNSFTGVGGTSLTGTGFILDLQAGNGATYGDYIDYNYINQGQHYVVGDEITISGTQLGGTTPTNDLTVTVTSVSVGEIIGITPSGTHQQTIVKLSIDYGIDFDTPGTWQVGESMGQECFVWTFDWAKSFSAEDGTSQDRLFSLAVDSDGMIYTAGEGYGGVSGDIENVELALLTKLDTDGDLVWARVLNETDDNCQAKCVAVDSTRDLVVTTHYSPGPGRTVVSKFDMDGNLGWQLMTSSNDDSSLALDLSGNIYVVCEAYYAETAEYALKVFKLSSTGQVLWRRWLGTRSWNEMKNGRNIQVVGENIFITAYTGAVDNNFESGFAARLPTDGGSLGEYDYYFWREDFYTVELRTTNYVGPVDIQVRNTTVENDLDSDYYVDWYSQDNNVVPVRDGDGGAIIFGDGSVQTTSAIDISQKLAAGGTRRLGMEDRGKHIYVTFNTTILVPYNDDVAMPIGSTVVIINNSNSLININVDGGGTTLIVPGLGNNASYTLSDEGMATLIKVDTEVWFMSGATLEVFAP
jgi:hypothetical protein